MTTTNVSRRGVLQLGLGGLAVVGFAGCAGLGGDDDPKNGSRAGAVTISILDRPRTTDSGRLAAYDAMVAGFQKSHPDIVLDVRDQLDGGAMTKTMPAKLANGTMETLFSMAPEAALVFAAKDQLALVDDALSSWEGLDTVRADVLDAVRDADGHLFGLPSRSNIRGIYYSRTQFEDAGLDPDAPPTTWDDLREAAMRLTDADNNKYGFGDLSGPDAAISFLNWLYAAGGVIHEDVDGAVVARLDSAEARSALELIYNMRWVDNSMSPVLYKSISDDLMGEMATGRVAMAIHAPTGTSDIRVFGADLDDYSFGPTPQNGGNAAYESREAFCFAPNASTKQLQAATTYGIYKQFDPGVLEARLKAQADEGAFVPLQSDSVGVLQGGSELREELDAIQAKYATVSAASSEAYYAATNEFVGRGIPQFQPEVVITHIGAAVEAVRTDKDVDLDALLADLNAKTQEAIDAG
jgi:multiple sugar transport system substrate-binding protein